MLNNSYYITVVSDSCNVLLCSAISCEYFLTRHSHLHQQYTLDSRISINGTHCHMSDQRIVHVHNNIFIISQVLN